MTYLFRILRTIGMNQVNNCSVVPNFLPQNAAFKDEFHLICAANKGLSYTFTQKSYIQWEKLEKAKIFNYFPNTYIVITRFAIFQYPYNEIFYVLKNR